jgi:hypothetical protein
MDHGHARETPMRSLSRIAVMVVVSLLTLTICGGGYADRNAFEFVGLLLIMFWGLPLIGLMTLFHFLDRRFGCYARYPVALIGLFPLLLVIYFGGQGDAIFMRNIILSGLAWSAAWLATSHIFGKAPPDVAVVVLALLLMLPWAWIVTAAVTGHGSPDRRVAEQHSAPRDEPKFFGEITGAKMRRCREHRCVELTCGDRKC